MTAQGMPTAWPRRLFAAWFIGSPVAQAMRPNARDNLSLIVEATRDSHAIAQFRIYRAAQVQRRG